MSNQTNVNLDRVVFVGRTYEEYLRYFEISTAELIGKKILDCPGGSSSFTVEANEFGIDAIASDILYGKNHKELTSIAIKDMKHGYRNARKVLGNTAKDRLKANTKSYRKFIKDFDLNNDRYNYSYLPDKMPFEDRAFDIVLSGHFLFVYRQQFDFSFHLKSLLELKRVAREQVRVFPISDLEGKIYPEMNTLREKLSSYGINSNINEISDPSQNGWDQYLLLT